MTPAELDMLTVNTIRVLAADAIQKANSGHPGTPMGAAPTAYSLWRRILRYDPAAPQWINRDRFVLSSGHASMLLYALLHLAGVRDASGGEAVSLKDIETFRQAGSRCPGHPEYGWTAGVETTTGPLGQGLATSVGMAGAGAFLAATYNRPDFDIFDFNVYALCGDGDMMEGISSEAASLAGHLRLANLCWIYDSNCVTIEGHTNLAFTEDVAARFLAYGWNVETVADPNDLDQVEKACNAFLATTDRPTLIVVHSHIGFGSPHKHDSPEAHGEPLGALELALTKQFLGFDPDRSFVVPDGVREHMAQGLGVRGAALRQEWEAAFARYRALHPDLADQIDRMARRDLPDGWDAALPRFPADPKGLSTRDASGKALNAVGAAVPWLVGGAADLAPSTKTRLLFEGADDFQAYGDLGDRSGRNFHFGIREHAMCAIVNGMTLTGLRAFGSGFLIFTDYARGAIRLASLMDLPVLHVWTHDSIGVGEDGPTHQPIEQLASLRAIPGMVVIRPADANETVEAYRFALQNRSRPVALICSRQPLPVLDRDRFAPASGLARGAYIVTEADDGAPDVILVATGSEVSLCLSARELLAREGLKCRVVSMPSWEIFEEQDEAYRQSVLPPGAGARVTVEEASPMGWERYAGGRGVTLAMRSFGMSAPLKVVAEHFGFTPETVAQAARQAIAQNR
jgi:transketolase